MLAEIAYNLILCTAGQAVLPIVSRKLREDPAFLRGRLGYYDIIETEKRWPRIWFHASSVGEVTGAVPTLHAVKRQLPGAGLSLTVGTPQGYRFARNQLPDWITVLPFPLDFPWVLRRALHMIRPDLYVSFESEFWPNLLFFLRRREIPAVLLNGRLSRRSLRSYKALGPLFRPAFEHFTWLAMHSEEDRGNIHAMGVPPHRTMVLGSSKYDGLLAKAQPEKASRWRDTLSIPEGTPVLVGGSLRRSECLLIPDIYGSMRKAHPELVGIFVPRHLDQVPNIARRLNEQQIPFQFLTQLESGQEQRKSPVIVVDRIGVLFELYSIGDLIFCGGTLEPIGGHNILEPAAWAKAVFYGPHLQKVLHEHTILRSSGGSFPVQSAEELQEKWTYWIEHLPELRVHGERARTALLQLGGVTLKQVELITEALSGMKARRLGRS